MDQQQKKEEVIKLAQCLVEFIQVDNPNTNDYNVLQFIAEESINRVRNFTADEPPMLTSKDIHKGVVPSADENKSSNWLNPIFSKIDSKLRKEVEGPLSRFAQQKGLTQFPWIQKLSTSGGQGHASKYWLVGLPIIENIHKPTNKYKAKDDEIEYTPVKEIKANFLAKLILGRELAMNGFRKWILILFPIISAITIMTLAYLIYLGWFLKPAPITTKTLATLGSIYIGYLIIKDYKSRSDRFLEDRVVMASDWFLKFEESNVLQELVTIKDENNTFSHKEVRLTKYVSTCAICGEKIYLDYGEPEFPRRIIGRCNESPREHIYSFDRVTLLGSKLR
jgi:hypothetical protein